MEKDICGMKDKHLAFTKETPKATIVVDLYKLPWGILTRKSVDVDLGKDGKIRKKVMSERNFYDASTKEGKTTFARAFGYYKLKEYNKA